MFGVGEFRQNGVYTCTLRFLFLCLGLDDTARFRPRGHNRLEGACPASARFLAREFRGLRMRLPPKR